MFKPVCIVQKYFLIIKRQDFNWILLHWCFKFNYVFSGTLYSQWQFKNVLFFSNLWLFLPSKLLVFYYQNFIESVLKSDRKRETVICIKRFQLTSNIIFIWRSFKAILKSLIFDVRFFSPKILSSVFCKDLFL